MSKSDHESEQTPARPVARIPLLTATLDDPKNVERVEVKQISMPPNLSSGLHLHPCPVVGVITQGSIFFQVEGQPAQILQAGSGFFEPANTKVPHFDAQGQGATFVACYLLGPAEHELIRMPE